MDNLLLVTVDSLRADHVGAWGYDRETTPNIDALASSGHVFENAFAHACGTRYSFPSILTSSYALMYGGPKRISKQRTLLAEALSGEGYRTAGFHSNLYLGADFGYDRGFDTFYDSKTDPSVTTRLRQGLKDRLDSNGLVYRWLARAVDTAEREAGTNLGSAYVPADETTQLAIDWIDGTDPDAAHFLWVHYMDPHHPYLPPETHQRAFRDSPIDERRAIQLRRKMIESPDAVTDEELRAIIDLYDAEIRFTDAEIDRLVGAARRRWNEHTSVAVTADHGEEFHDHGQFSHRATFHDEVTHVPLVVDIDDDGGHHEELVGLLDLAPTLIAQAGGPQPDQFYGNSLRSLIDGNGWEREAILGDALAGGDRRFAYRDTDWKYIRRDDDGTEYLYDLTTDPGETTDVAAENDEVLERLRERIDDHERAIDETATDLGEVEMDESVKERLRDLGYQE